MNSNQLFAHPGQSLAEHLAGVARLAKGFAKRFQCEDHAELAGLLHDMGKADVEFQKRITKAAGLASEDGEKRPHAPHGAALALKHQLWSVAFAIYGHHAGLHDRSAVQQVASKWTARAHECEAKLKAAGEWQIAQYGSPLPAWLERITSTTACQRDAKMRAVEFYTRMLFSALVDADRLDTENANSSIGSRANVLKRKTWRFGPECLAAKVRTERQTIEASESLLQILDAAILQRVAKARSKNASEAVLNVRADVLTACKEKAARERGVFTLPVPTGGGKTLASIAFALQHIAHHNKPLAEGAPRRLRRVIVVIPYLNIIQQTTRELRDVFKCVDADPLILEHHSQAADPVIQPGDGEEDSDGYDRQRPLRQLAAENWDAPVVVTTSVQFFNSLFSRRPADARKLHNICQSVLIFDEVQTLPPLLLQPILDALKELTHPQRPYGCSLVLCTATQPALGQSGDFEFGFENVTPIIDPKEAAGHFNKLKRVKYYGLTKAGEPPTMDNDALVAAMLAAPRQQALAILNTRKQARKLFDLLAENAKDDESLRGAIFHLSTWMYPAHRLQVLAEVTKRLSEGKPCLLVSTQCVEAGVDVDFPAVWRAFGPYDSIVQAAGRCNRSGALKDASGHPTLGQIHVFTPSDAVAPQGIYASAMQTATLLCRMDKADPHDPNSFERYFRLLYQATVPDPGGCAVQSAREKLHFEEVSKLFNFIDADSAPLLIESAVMPDGTSVAEWRKATVEKGFFTPDEWRAIQPYIVNLAYPSSMKTRSFLNATDSPLAFKGDDPDRGLRLLKIHEPKTYHDGPNGCGLDLECAALRDLANYVL
jgi:CRISPR-associated endonuclease/helicase Cas3